MPRLLSSLAALAFGLTLALTACSSRSEPITEEEVPWALVFQEEFTHPNKIDDFARSDPAAWRWGRVEHNSYLELFAPSAYEPLYRSPSGIALLPDLLVADFDMELRVEQTGRNYAHRDLCVVFGFVAADRYYYTHLAPQPDANAHSVFAVDRAPRVSLLPPQAKGIEWGNDQWHTIRVERRTAEGTIRVFWDGGEEPIFEAEDRRFGWGRLGFGSFDDTGRVTEIQVWAPETRPVEVADPFAGLR